MTRVIVGGPLAPQGSDFGGWPTPSDRLFSGGCLFSVAFPQTAKLAVASIDPNTDDKERKTIRRVLDGSGVMPFEDVIDRSRSYSTTDLKLAPSRVLVAVVVRQAAIRRGQLCGRARMRLQSSAFKLFLRPTPLVYLVE